MLPISTYGEMASKLRQKERGGTQAKTSSGRGREYMDIVDALKRERDLLKELIQYLEEEIDSVISGDVETLEESMPHKKKILEAIAANREGLDLLNNSPGPEYAAEMRTLQQELVMLWKRSSGLNETSKEMVAKRLGEIQVQLEPFFMNLRMGYDKSGKVSKTLAHTIKSGV